MAASEYIFNYLVNKKLQHIIQTEFPKKKYNYKVEDATTKGDNYLGLVYRVTVQVNLDDKDVEEFRLIVKIPPQNLFRRNQFFARPSFLRESLAYTRFLPLIDKFQTDKALSDNEKFSEYPKCFAAITEEMNEAIFLADMCEQKYMLFDRFNELDMQHVTLVMRAYAKLHAASFAIKQHLPLEFSSFQNLEDVLAQRDDKQMLIYYEELIKRALSTLNKDADAAYYLKFKHFFEQHKFHKQLLLCLDATNAEPYAVVCHGDCWNNNMLFQYKQQQPIKVCLLDWQIMRYASPITDIMYYLFTSTTRKFRQQHYQLMLNIYYETMVQQLKRFSIENCLPRHIFEQQLKKFGVAGLLFAMIVLPLVTTRPENIPNLDELGELIESGGTINDLNNSSFLDGGQSDLYRERMRDVIIDMINLEYI